MFRLAQQFIFTTCLALIFATSPASAQQGNDGPLAVRSAAEVIEKWTPQQHLYSKGDLGVSADQLSKLEQWLTKNGPHWTVVLMENTDDESYTARDQRKFYKMDAVEHALGHGLANQTNFGQLLHPQTGETDGAVFVLFLAERKFSYYGSNAQDNRGLGDSHWIGELDRDAFRAMRNGGRIIDAVKDTVTTINSKLAAKIRNEAAAAEQAIVRAERATQERRRELDNLLSRIDETQNEFVKRVEESARQIRSAFPDAAASQLANPPLDQWKTQINNIRLDHSHIQIDEKKPYYQSPEFLALVQKLNDLRGDINHLLDLYAAHKSFGQMVSPVEQRLDLAADHPSGAAIPASDEAYRVLNEAKHLHARGEVDFAEKLQYVSVLTEQGEQAIQLEEQRLKDEENRQKIVRRTLSIAASILAALLLGLLWLLNLRRRPALNRAHLLFDRRSKSVEAELSLLQPTIQRCAKLLGNAEEFAAKHYQGQTEQIGAQALTHVQQLNSMSDEANGVVASAYRLIHPSNPIAEAANMFSGARYEHCVNLLNGESLRLTPSANATHSNDDKSSENLWQTFEQFYMKIRATQVATEQNLDEIEHGMSEIDRQLEILQTKLAAATKLEQKLASAARLDRYFQIPALGEKLLPAAASHFDAAYELAEHDPVQAVAVAIPDGRQKVDNGLAIAKAIQNARSNVFPELDIAAKELRATGFDVRWIENSINQLGDRANQLIVNAVAGNVAPEAEQFDSDLQRLGLRAKRCFELAHEVTEKVTPALNQLQQEIANQRKQLATELSMEPSQVLHETDYDPDEELQQARTQLQSARAAVNYGGVESVLESIEVIEIETATARDFIEKSISAVKSFAFDHATLSERNAAQTNQLPNVQASLSQIQSRYADSAMLIRAPQLSLNTNDLALRNPQPLAETAISVRELQSQTNQLVKSSFEACQRAKDLHSQGKVLESANLLQLTSQDLDHVDNLLQGIETHCQWLDQQQQENKIAIAERLRGLTTLQNSVADHRTQSESQASFTSLETMTARLHRELETADQGRDPFLDLQRLAELEAHAEELTCMLAADRNAHAETKLAVEAASQELKTARQSVFRSVNDKIPDSEMTKQSQRQVDALEAELKAIEKRIGGAHENWPQIAALADRITSELAIVDGTLRRELSSAQQAAEQLQSAAQAVYDASSWSGSYGITAEAKLGAHELAVARHSLSEGEYHAAIRHSEAAIRASEQAVATANRAVIQRRREIAHDSARRRKQESASAFSIVNSISSGSHSNSSWSSGSSWSGGSHSGSTGSSSSSSSGGSSSNSGFSRSGW